ncbi:MAG: HlyC/CorC family transporter [Pseudomonadota bacterium]
MNNISLEILFFLLVLLLALSAYFSSSETAMMSLNRYRLRHMAKHKHKGAMRASALLENPDRLLGVILIGNNFVIVLASSIATVIALRLWGGAGILISSFILTLVILIVSEVTPKTIAALHPEKIAYPSSFILVWLLWIFYPFVWVVSKISNAIVKLLGFALGTGNTRNLHSEELRAPVDDSSTTIPTQRHNMLSNVLDLKKVTVNDIMVPRNEVVGIDLEMDIDEIMAAILNSQHTRLPVYRNDLNNVVGILHMRGAVRFIRMQEVNKAELVQLTREAYFVPESTPLTTQLINFQKQKMRIALVVDEYGDVKGIITIEDILEEIVGNFTTNMADETADIHPQTDGTFLIDGSASIRNINRKLDWDLPTDGPKTLNGLLTEMLENIPETHVGIRLPFHCAEILQVKDNMIKTVRMWEMEQNLPGTDESELQANQYD